MRETFIDGEKTILKTDFYLYLLQLETNWKELKKWLDTAIYNFNYLYHLHTICQYEDGIRAKTYENVLDKIQELESGNNE